MAKGIGRLLSVGFAKEASRGTAESTVDFWTPHSEVTVDDRDERVINEQAYGVIEDSVDEDITKQYAEISYGAPIGDQSIGLLLLSALGAVSSDSNADGSGNVYDHTFSVGQSAQHQSLTVFLNDPLGGQDYAHDLAVVETLELTYERGEYVTVNATMKAQKGEADTLTPSITSENRFLPQHLTFKTASSKAGLGAASAIKVKSVTLTIEKNLEDDDVLGQVAPEDFLNKQFTITGTIEAIWQNESDFKTQSLAGTARAMRLDLVSDATIGTSANPQLRIDLAKVKFRPVTRPIGTDDIVMQTVEFKAFYSTGDSEMIEAILTNLVTSY